ncbi:MAG: hypothetical protein AAGA60_29205 [Cyanobacteria bacterium P01_E01_bin.42]
MNQPRTPLEPPAIELTCQVCGGWGQIEREVKGEPTDELIECPECYGTGVVYIFFLSPKLAARQVRSQKLEPKIPIALAYVFRGFYGEVSYLGKVEEFQIENPWFEKNGYSIVPHPHVKPYAFALITPDKEVWELFGGESPNGIDLPLDECKSVLKLLA